MQICDNRNYVLSGSDQLCHMCGEVEPPLRKPTDDEQTNRSAMHMVHKVRFHLNTTWAEWNRS